MPLSNPKWEIFVQEIAKGASLTAAYEKSGYKAKGRTAEASASRLLSNVVIKQRLAEIQEKAAEKAIVSKAWIMTELMENALIASGKKTLKVRVKCKNSDDTFEADLNMRDGAVTNRALELLGKELGMFIDRREVGDPGEFSRMSDEELVGEILRMNSAANVPLDKETEH